MKRFLTLIFVGLVAIAVAGLYAVKSPNCFLPVFLLAATVVCLCADGILNTTITPKPERRPRGHPPE